MNITSAIFELELGYTFFTVERITCIRSREGIISSSHTELASGCIHPGTVEMLKLLPEEEKSEQYIVVYTDCSLSTGTPEHEDSFTTADRIHWNGQVWRVVKVRDWRGFGYCQAIAVLINE